MKWFELNVLDELGFSIYEKKALATLSHLGVADAASLCREGDIPTSKIYLAMEKLADLGVAEIQPTRPKLYAALPADTVVDRLVAASRARAERFATQSQELRDLLSGVRGRVAGHAAFADLALGVESHVKRHLVQLASAKQRILSYVEQGDLTAISRITREGFPVLRRIARSRETGGVEHRIIFGFTKGAAPVLVEFLRAHEQDLSGVTGVRYSGELGHPFHVLDQETVILSLDHPFIPEGRFASLLVRDAELVRKLSAGFEELWNKAMLSLNEVRFDPRGDER